MNPKRRQLLKNSAIGGGISKLWATPIISSLALPAHAQTSPVVQEGQEEEEKPAVVEEEEEEVAEEEEEEKYECLANEFSNDAFTDSELPVAAQVLSVNQFAGTAEDLTSVKVTLRARVHGDGQFENRQLSETTYTLNINSEYTYLLPFPSSTSHTFELSDSKQVTLASYDGTLDFSGASSTDFEVQMEEKTYTFELTDADDIAVFIGEGTVDFIAEVSGTFNALGSSQQANATFLFADGSVEVEYVCA